MSKRRRDPTDTDDDSSSEQDSHASSTSTPADAVDKASAIKLLPHIDRVCSMLKNDRYKPPLTIGVFNRKYIHSKVDSNIDKFPFKPLKRNIPWISVQKQSYSSKNKSACTLSEELLQLSKYLAPTEDEIQCRLTLIEDIADVIHAKFPSSSVEPFGSYCSNLSTFLSDIDISIEGKASKDTSLHHSDAEDDHDEGDEGDDDGEYDGDETLRRFTSTSTSSSDVYNDTLTFNNIIVANPSKSPVNTSDSNTRFEEIKELGSIYHHMVAMSWMKAGEFRRRARVPIISLLHSNGIQCDVSIRTASNSKLIDSMKNAYNAELFVALASFLKIFLGQLELDKPFTGGIGSFKLYVMIAYILENLHKGLTEKQLAAQTVQFDVDDTEWVLTMFFKFYGNSSRFNESTILRVCPPNSEPIEATFDGNNELIPKCQKAFLKAFKVITNHESDVGKLFEGKNSQIYSTSLLGRLIDTALLESQRQKSKSSCKEYKRKTSNSKTHIARMILARLLKNNGMNNDISLEAIRCVRPFYHVLLKSFASIDDACSYKKPVTNHKITHNNPNIGSTFSHTGVTGNGIYHSKPKSSHHSVQHYNRHQYSKKYRR